MCTYASNAAVPAFVNTSPVTFAGLVWLFAALKDNCEISSGLALILTPFTVNCVPTIKFLAILTPPAAVMHHPLVRLAATCVLPKDAPPELYNPALESELDGLVPVSVIFLM
jgi:hypothetical protein